LSNKIRQQDDIIGIKVGDEEKKLARFADDTSCTLKYQHSVKLLFRTLSEYGRIYGLKINEEKTELDMWIGSNKDSNQNIPGLPLIQKKAKLLGIIIVFRVLAPWWQSGESDLGDSLARQTFAPSYITPPNMNPKSSVIQKLQSGRELNQSFCVFM
jgi:hypothetical protein